MAMIWRGCLRVEALTDETRKEAQVNSALGDALPVISVPDLDAAVDALVEGAEGEGELIQPLDLSD